MEIHVFAPLISKIEKVMQMPLTAGAKLIYFTLLLANDGEPVRMAQAEIARRCGMSERCVNTHLKNLEYFEIIEVDPYMPQKFAQAGGSLYTIV